MRRYSFVIAGIIILLAGVFLVDHRVWLIDDRDHPDAVLLAEAFAGARSENRSQINVIALNGGSWFAVCLVGPGENPQAVMTDFGAKRRLRIPKVQRVRSWLYAGAVPQGEIALLILTDKYSIRSRRLPNLTGNPEFKSACGERHEPGLRWR